MKKVLSCFVLFIMNLLFLMSCSSDSESDSLEARYYVKYEVKFRTYHKNPDKYISFTTDKGIEKIVFTEDAFTVSWEGIYGPVC